MYIEPNTTIIFFQNVPLDPSYDNTVLYDSKESQIANFILKRKMTFERNSYQRVNRGYIRVNTCADNLYDCNYLAFKNTNYGNKWFYAFVTSVEFVNNETCEIGYEIDVLQTYMFDYELGQCFIERQHTETDEIGDNIIPEPLATGEMITSSFQPLSIDLTQMCVVLNVMWKDTYQDRGRLIDGVYGGSCLFAFRADAQGIVGLNNMVATYDFTPDKIINIYMCPKVLLGLKDITIPNEGYRVPASTLGAKYVIDKDSNNRSFAIDTIRDGFGTYISPKNNKLYTYPYNYFCVSNANGETMDLKYEFFESSPKLMLTCNGVSPAEAVIRPVGYKGVSYDTTSPATSYPFVGDGVTISGFPFCSWQSDAFIAWLAQTAMPSALSALPALVNTNPTMELSSRNVTVTSGWDRTNIRYNKAGEEVGRSVGNKTGERKVSETYSSTSSPQATINHMVSEVLGSGVGAMINNMVFRGNASSSSNNIANKLHTFYTYRCHCNADFAEMIDNYFTVFGYAINKIAVPNISARPRYTYVKTMNCQAEGGMPADDLARIKAIFDNGVTFWRYMDDVGNYDVDNAPISTQEEE